MSIDEDTIETLYGKPSTEAVETEADEPTGDTPAQEASTGELDEHGYEQPAEQPTGNPYELSENKNTIEDDLYGAESKVELSSETDLSIIGETPEQEQMLSENLSFMASTVGASQVDMESLVEAANAQVITGVDHEPDDVMTTLYEQHGKELSGMLQDAQRLVASYPQLSEWLDSSGGGNNPQIINQIMRISQLPRAQKRIETILARGNKEKDNARKIASTKAKAKAMGMTNLADRNK